MSGSLNKVTLIGNLGADPEIRHTNDSKPIANMRIATSERWKDTNGNRVERTEWHRVVIFSEGLANVAEKYLQKGSKVYLEGQLRTRKWTDRDGNDRYSTEIHLQGYDAKLVMLDSANRNGGPNGNSGSSNDEQDPPASGGGDLDDDIPF